jgi:drug/metabolite transporter (DMT)-like permease
MISGTVMLLPFIGPVPEAIGDASAQALEAVVFLALGASALGFFAWAYANTRLPVSRAATTLYLVPAVAILVAWVWLDQLPSPSAGIGGLVAICGVVLINTGRRQPHDPVRLGSRRTLACRRLGQKGRSSTRDVR